VLADAGRSLVWAQPPQRGDAPLAETLRLNGYATAHVGKCHEVVRIDLGDDSHDHFIDPEQVLHFAMSRQ
jgi:arylsulfatase A-like enzyme